MKHVVILLGLLLSSAIPANTSVMDSLHNLSATGPGKIKSQSTDQVCVFCHTPHRPALGPGLWNKPVNQASITTYQSSTAKAVPREPTGTSALCLTCHDGTIALGEMLRPPRGRGNANNSDLRGTFLRGRSGFGTNLSNHHPIGFEYDLTLKNANSGLVHPSTVDLPMTAGEMECTVCHDPHSSNFPPFLHKPSLNGELCLTCHIQSGENWEWSNSAHAESTITPRSGNPWSERKPEWAGKTVAENACENCHATHNAATPARLIKDREERTCFRCHNGSVAEFNIQAETQKFYRHPVERSSIGIHDASKREFFRSTPLHVECEDCHNPHATRKDLPMISFNPGNPYAQNHTEPPYANGSIAGVAGIDINGQHKGEIEYEYEMCFKCHGVPGNSSCDNRRCSTATNYQMSRQDNVYNLREKLDPSNPSLISYHPVTSNDPSNDTEVPSLRFDTPLRRDGGQIYCGDCHGSENSPAAGGSGPAGPHGSQNESMLALSYDLSRSTGQSGALCLKCHDAGNLFNNESFLHREHVLEQGASCATCHDPHGSSAFPHLINFLVSSSASGQLQVITGTGSYDQPTWEDNGRYSGTCYLNCHGTVHDGSSY